MRSIGSKGPSAAEGGGGKAVELVADIPPRFARRPLHRFAVPLPAERGEESACIAGGVSPAAVWNSSSPERHASHGASGSRHGQGRNRVSGGFAALDRAGTLRRTACMIFRVGKRARLGSLEAARENGFGSPAFFFRHEAVCFPVFLSSPKPTSELGNHSIKRARLPSCRSCAIAISVKYPFAVIGGWASGSRVQISSAVSSISLVNSVSPAFAAAQPRRKADSATR